MKHISQRLHTIIFCIAFVAAICFYQGCLISTTTFLGLLVSIGTIYFGSLKLKIENDILFKDLFQSFNARYDAEMNDLINELKIAPSRELTSAEITKIIDYFNLCAEEFLWKSKNRIPNDVWKAWKAGILENLNIKQIQEVYEKETMSISGRASYYGLYEELKK